MGTVIIVDDKNEHLSLCGCRKPNHQKITRDKVICLHCGCLILHNPEKNK